MPPKGKGKLSRKAQIRQLAQAKKRRRTEDSEDSDDPDFDMEMEKDQGVADYLEEEEPGAAVKRQRDAERKRRDRKKVRGLSQQAQTMAGWLIQPQPAEEQLERAEAERAALEEKAQAEEAARRAEVAARKEKEAALERERYQKRKADLAASTPPAVRPRLGATLSSCKSSSTRKRNRSCLDEGEASTGKKRRRRISVSAEAAAAITRISKKCRFDKSDIVHGETMSRVEWAQIKRDHMELRRVYAMNIYIKLRRGGMGSRQAYADGCHRGGKSIEIAGEPPQARAPTRSATVSKL